jgi:hypothetical protein
MPDFVEFSRREARVAFQEPSFALTPSGILSFNFSAFRALGQPESVAILFDNDERIIALHSVKSDHINAYRVKKLDSRLTVEIRDFILYYNIRLDAPQEFKAIQYAPAIWGFPLAPNPFEITDDTPKTRPAATDCWRHITNGSRAPSLMRLGEVVLSRPSPASSPPGMAPTMRIGITIACEPAERENLTATTIRRRLLTFLNHSSATNLATEQELNDADVIWQPYGGRGRAIYEAILVPDESEPTLSPTASAFIFLPDIEEHGYRDSRYAEFILEFNVNPVLAADPVKGSLSAWHNRFVRSLLIVDEFATFLASKLHLRTFAEPSPEFGIWLKAPRSMLDIIDIGQYRVIPGSATANWFIGYLVADPEGRTVSGAAAELIGQLCESTLHLDDFETLVHRLSTRGSSNLRH